MDEMITRTWPGVRPEKKRPEQTLYCVNCRQPLADCQCEHTTAGDEHGN